VLRFTVDPPAWTKEKNFFLLIFTPHRV